MARRRVPVYLRPQELERLFAEAPTARDRLMLVIGAYAGLRVSEIVKLRVEDIDFEDGMIEVRRAKGDKDRTIPLHHRIAWDMRTHLAGRREGWVFPSTRGTSGHLMSRAVQEMILLAAARAQIVRHVTPHKLRHSFATLALAKGADLMDIKELLGHANVATTQVYLSVQPERLRSAIDRL